VIWFAKAQCALERSDLCHATIDKQFDSGDIAAIIRREKQDRFRNLIWTANPAQWHASNQVRF
jgi:hypothetical protein